MKELLYIPSGRYVKFYPEDEELYIVDIAAEGHPRLLWSVQELVEHRLKYKQQAINRFSTGRFFFYEDIIQYMLEARLPSHRKHAEIPLDTELLRSEFEIIETDGEKLC